MRKPGCARFFCPEIEAEDLPKYPDNQARNGGKRRRCVKRIRVWRMMKLGGPVLFELKGEDDVRECGKKEGLNDGWEGEVKGKVMPCHQGGKKAKVKNEGSEREVDQRERERESEQ